jgi:hypothetical protein
LSIGESAKIANNDTEKIGIAIANAVATFIVRLSAALELESSIMADPQDDAAKKVREAMIEIVTRTFDRASAYTNLIMLGGYAGAFAIWSFTREYLPKTATILVALLLGVSLCTFILFEVFKMFFSTKTFMRQRELLVHQLPPQQFLQELSQFRTSADTLVLKVVMPIWRVAMVISVGTALGAIAILFYNFLAILIGWPLWPK